MTAWPDFPSAVSEGASQRLQISFIWKRLRWKCRTNKKGPEGGTATKSWISHRCSNSDVNTVTDLRAVYEFCHKKVKDKATWDGFPATWLTLSFQASLMQLFSLNGLNYTISSQASHWTVWLCCYLKRMSVPRRSLWPTLFKTANRWNRWAPVRSSEGTKLPLKEAHFIMQQIPIQWPLNGHRCTLSQRTMLLRGKRSWILLLQTKA